MTTSKTCFFNFTNNLKKVVFTLKALKRKHAIELFGSYLNIYCLSFMISVENKNIDFLRLGALDVADFCQQKHVIIISPTKSGNY